MDVNLDDFVEWTVGLVDIWREHNDSEKSNLSENMIK